MNKESFTLLFISLFMVYTQGLWERLLSLPAGTSIIVELPLWAYFFLSLKKLEKPAPAINLVIIYVFVTFISGFSNNNGIFEWVKYIRFFLYFYLIYVSLWNSTLALRQWLKLLKFSILLIIIQGVGSAFNIFVLGQRVEGHVGLMSSLGGTTAATFPLLIFIVVAVIYIFTRNQGNKFNWYLILIIISVTLVGYGSGKRAIFFTIPVFLLGTIFLSYFSLKGNKYFYKKMIALGFITLLIIPAYFYGITTSKGLNYGLRGNESNIEILLEAFDYAESYEKAITQQGTTIGRTSTTAQVISESTDNIETFLFGYGFQSHKDESTAASIGIGYGIVGFTRDVTSGGWFVMLLTFLIISKIILTSKSVNYKFTRVLRLVIFAIFVFTHFGYSSDFVVSLKINYLMLILLVFINSPANADHLKSVIERYFYSGLKK